MSINLRIADLRIGLVRKYFWEGEQVRSNDDKIRGMLGNAIRKN